MFIFSSCDVRRRVQGRQRWTQTLRWWGQGHVQGQRLTKVIVLATSLVGGCWGGTRNVVDAINSRNWNWNWNEFDRTTSSTNMLCYRTVTDAWALIHVNPLTPTDAIMGTTIKHHVPSFVIFDIRALWCSALSVRVSGCQKLQMTA